MPAGEWNGKPVKGLGEWIMNGARIQVKDHERYVRYIKSRLKELVGRYDPGVLWFGGEWEHTWTQEHDKMLRETSATHRQIGRIRAAAEAGSSPCPESR